MGNSCSSADEKAAAIATLAEGAAAGARQAVTDEFHKAAGAGSGAGSGAGGRGDVAGSGAAGAIAGAGSGAGGRGDVAGAGAAGAGEENPHPHGDDEVVIAGVLSLVDGQNAAAQGAINGLDSMQRHVRTTQRAISDLGALKTAAACGSAAGLRAVATMAARRRNAARVGANVDLENPDIPAEERPEYVLSAAATGARAAALSAPTHLAVAGGGSHVCYHTRALARWRTTSAFAAYVLVMNSAVWIKGLVFGFVAVGYFVACTGAITGFLGRSSATLQ